MSTPPITTAPQATIALRRPFLAFPDTIPSHDTLGEVRTPLDPCRRSFWALWATVGE